jgi:hypothetical protein
VLTPGLNTIFGALVLYTPAVLVVPAGTSVEVEGVFSVFGDLTLPPGAALEVQSLLLNGNLTMELLSSAIVVAGTGGLQIGNLAAFFPTIAPGSLPIVPPGSVTPSTTTLNWTIATVANGPIIGAQNLQVLGVYTAVKRLATDSSCTTSLGMPKAVVEGSALSVLVDVTTTCKTAAAADQPQDLSWWTSVRIIAISVAGGVFVLALLTIVIVAIVRSRRHRAVMLAAQATLAQVAALERESEQPVTAL